MEKETLEEAAENYGWRIKTNTFSDPVKANDLANSAKQDFIKGAKWQGERMYSRQDIIDFVNFINDRHFNKYTVDTDEVDLFIEQFKKK